MSTVTDQHISAPPDVPAPAWATTVTPWTDEGGHWERIACLTVGGLSDSSVVIEQDQRAYPDGQVETDPPTIAVPTQAVVIDIDRARRLADNLGAAVGEARRIDFDDRLASQVRLTRTATVTEAWEEAQRLGTDPGLVCRALFPQD